MLLAQLELNEAAEVEFGIEIHGTAEKTSDIRFIIEGPTYGIVCKCTESNGTITASIPKLKGILPAGQFDAKLEVVIDGKYFVPLRESIEFKPLVEFDVTSTKARPTVETTVSTRAVKVKVIEETDKESEPDDTSTVSTVKEPQPAKVAQPNSTQVKGDTSGNAPAETWDQIVKKSITRPDNAPKVEKGGFDYESPAPFPAKKQTTRTDKPQTTKQEDTTSKESANSPKKTSINKEKAQQILEKLNGFKSALSKIKSKDAT